MILRFPNLDAFQLAITSGVVPEAVWLTSAESVLDEDGSVWIKSGGKLPRNSARELKQLGVAVVRSLPKAEAINLCCWLQAIPLHACPQPAIGDVSPHVNEFRDNTTVLFHLSTEKNLADLVSEMLRLGNDRQSFRYLQTLGRQPFDNRQNLPVEGGSSSLLRVIGPPYYSLLRAIDQTHRLTAPCHEKETGKASAPGEITAYVESSPRVWTQYGFTHPLGARVTPPAGKLLLIKPDHSWLFIKEAPFRDIYESAEFLVPNVETEWIDQALESKIKVPLSLTRGNLNESAEMWVLSKNGLAQIENKIINACDDELLKRLAFAVCESEDQEPCVILRVRPSRKPPPVLVLDGLRLRSYLGIPNLFLPIGQRLHPPLRRDAVTRLLAPQSQNIVWVEPVEASRDERQHSQVSFLPQSIADVAFRPLTDWVEYVLDHEEKPLKAWMASYRFNFDSFKCDDDHQPEETKPQSKPNKRLGNEKKADQSDSSAATQKFDSLEENKNQNDFKLADGDFEVMEREPSQLQFALNSIEEEFFELDVALDSPSRQPLWREMATIHSQLDHQLDTTICWSNVIWNSKDGANRSKDCEAWLACEVTCSRLQTFGVGDLDRHFKNRSTRPLDSSLVVAFLVWAANEDEIPEGLTSRLNEAAQFIERQEQLMPVRTSWLAWNALFKLSGNDTLLLARARDRILQRLFDHGLPAEYDMPSFMRARGIGQTDRFSTLFAHVQSLQGLIHDWIEEPVAGSDPKTKVYADLMFAFGLAKLGEVSRAKSVMTQARDLLTSTDAIHHWLGNAYEYRVTQALNGQSTKLQFSDHLLKRLKSMQKMDRYKVDRLRGLSRILEPHQRINAFTRWHQRHADDLDKQLSSLSDMTDRDELNATVTDLLRSTQTESDKYGRVLAIAMELAPRLGEDFAKGLFDEVLVWLNEEAPTMARANLLQKSIYVAAHFGRVDIVQSFVHLFENSLANIVSEYLTLQSNYHSLNKEKVDAIESLFTESFRGLRKLGLREEIGRLYSGVESLIEKHEPYAKKQRQAKNTKADIDATRPLRLLLCVASGWYYFGQDQRAGVIVEEVRSLLLSADMTPIEQKDLACAYVNCVSHAPVDYAVGMIKELFQCENDTRTLDNIKDNMTTSSHFSISQLHLIEATVLALVSDEFSLNDECRRWLDEDEFLVRHKIHHDVRKATDK
ncbi:MAG: hypothetical protein P8J27_00150 [Mariniblastus sp.]|nr:hypothetical protein [Mariniblastus sp.]